MNKIQLNAALMVAEMRFNADPSDINKSELEKAQLAFDSFEESEATDEGIGEVIGKGEGTGAGEDSGEGKSDIEKKGSVPAEKTGVEKKAAVPAEKTGVEKKAAVPAEKTTKVVDKKK